MNSTRTNNLEKDLIRVSLTPTSPHLCAAREIYEESFPPCERVAFDDLLNSLEISAYLLDGDVVGMGGGYSAGKYWYSSYLAVRRDLRNRGLGARIIEAALRLLGGEILFSVEAPDANAPDDDIRRRRIRLYERHGARLTQWSHTVNGVQYLSMAFGLGDTPAELAEAKSAYEYFNEISKRSLTYSRHSPIRECWKVAGEPRFRPWETIPRKSRLRRFMELYRFYRKDRLVCREYFALGLDAKGVRSEDFLRINGDMNRRLFMPERQRYLIDRFAFLQDKYVFDLYAADCRIPHVRCRGFVRTEGSSTLDGEQMPREEAIRRIATGNLPVVIKVNGSSNGRGVSIARTADDVSRLLADDTRDSVIQDLVVQHPDLARVYPDAVNILRIPTYSSYRKCEFGQLLGAVAVFGRNGAALSNSGLNGIAVGIGAEGRLFDYGHSFDVQNHPTLFREHPNTGIAFSGIEIPFYREAVEMVIGAHRYFHQVGVIGWDVVITPTGPTILEGNAYCGLEDNEIAHRTPLYPLLKAIGLYDQGVLDVGRIV